MTDYYSEGAYDYAMTPEQAKQLRTLHDDLVEYAVAVSEGDNQMVITLDLLKPHLKEFYSDKSYLLDEAEYSNFEFHYYSEEGVLVIKLPNGHANLDFLAHLFVLFINRYNYPHPMPFNVAHTATKLVADGFGGEAFVAHKDGVDWMSTTSWIQDTVESLGSSLYSKP